MKDKVASLVKYILKNYPYKDDLSASRVTKMLYLADWKSAIEKSKLISNSSWYYNHYGPYVEDFVSAAESDHNIIIKKMPTSLGGTKRLLSLKNIDENISELTDEDKFFLDFVIDATKSKSYSDFIKLVYSTYPVVSSEKYEKLDLIEASYEYKKLKELSAKNSTPSIQ